MTSVLWVLLVLQRRRDERRRPVWRQNASNEKLLRRQRQGHDITLDITMTLVNSDFFIYHN